MRAAVRMLPKGHGAAVRMHPAECSRMSSRATRGRMAPSISATTAATTWSAVSISDEEEAEGGGGEGGEGAEEGSGGETEGSEVAQIPVGAAEAAAVGAEAAEAEAAEAAAPSGGAPGGERLHATCTRASTNSEKVKARMDPDSASAPSFMLMDWRRVFTEVKIRLRSVARSCVAPSPTSLASLQNCSQLFSESLCKSVFFVSTGPLTPAWAVTAIPAFDGELPGLGSAAPAAARYCMGLNMAAAPGLDVGRCTSLYLW